MAVKKPVIQSTVQGMMPTRPMNLHVMDCKTGETATYYTEVRANGADNQFSKASLERQQEALRKATKAAP